MNEPTAWVSAIRDVGTPAALLAAILLGGGYTAFRIGRFIAPLVKALFEELIDTLKELREASQKQTEILHRLMALAERQGAESAKDREILNRLDRRRKEVGERHEPGT